MSVRADASYHIDQTDDVCDNNFRGRDTHTLQT